MEEVKALSEENRRAGQNLNVDNQREVSIPESWANLRELFKGNVQAFNQIMQQQYLSWDSVNSDEVRIRHVHDDKTLIGEYDDASMRFHFVCPQAEIDLACTVEIQGEREVFLQNNVPVEFPVLLSPYEITYDLLRSFLLN